MISYSGPRTNRLAGLPTELAHFVHEGLDTNSMMKLSHSSSPQRHSVINHEPYWEQKLLHSHPTPENKIGYSSYSRYVHQKTKSKLEKELNRIKIQKRHEFQRKLRPLKNILNAGSDAVNFTLFAPVLIVFGGACLVQRGIDHILQVENPEESTLYHFVGIVGMTAFFSCHKMKHSVDRLIESRVRAHENQDQEIAALKAKLGAFTN